MQFDAAFIFLKPGTDPATDRVARKDSGGTTLIVFTPEGLAAARVAGELAASGTRLIELYRGFDLTSAAQVLDAVAGRTPVGVDIRAAQVDDLANWATIYTDPNADPARDRVAMTHADGSQTLVVAAPEDAIPALSVELAAAGTRAISLCGGTPLTLAARVKHSLGDSATLGLVTWPFESIEKIAAYKAAYEEANS